MKKIFFTLLSSCLLYLSSNAQFCAGGSDSTLCTPDTTLLSQPGFYPASDSAPAFINGTVYSTTIQFKNFDTIPGQTNPTVAITSLQINTISNLPAGLCWATNKKNNAFGQLESGCIVLSGTVCDTPGQYLLTITATINGFGPINLMYENPPVAYYLRVNNVEDVATPVDTSKKVPFYRYGSEVSTGCTPAGISEVEPVISTLSIVPNPMNTSATATFVSTRSGKMTEKITNIIGEQVRLAEREVKTGANTFTIQRNDMAPGVYFYTLTDGVNVVTKRMVVSE